LLFVALFACALSLIRREYDSKKTWEHPMIRRVIDSAGDENDGHDGVKPYFGESRLLILILLVALE
jgi:hypothetical protein